MISFFVKIIRETDHFFGAGRQAKLTAFASVFIDFDLSHYGSSKSTRLPFSMETCEKFNPNRHPGENRGPVCFKGPESSGFRLSPE
jgi:hypothetical protein